MSVSNKIGFTRTGVTEKQSHGNAEFTPIRTNTKLPLNCLICAKGAVFQLTVTARGCGHKAPQLFPPLGTPLTSVWQELQVSLFCSGKIYWNGCSAPLSLSFFGILVTKQTSNSSLHIFKLSARGTCNIEVWKDSILVCTWKVPLNDSQNTRLRTVCTQFYFNNVAELPDQMCWMVPVEVFPAPVTPSAPLYPFQRPNTFLFNMAGKVGNIGWSTCYLQVSAAVRVCHIRMSPNLSQFHWHIISDQ